MRIKVLHIITSLDPDGAQNMLLKLSQHVPAEQFEFKILNLRNPSKFGEQFAECGVAVEHLGMRRMIPSLSAVRKIAASIENYKPDLVQGWMYHGNLAATAGRALSSHKCPVLWNIRKATDIEDYRLMTRLVIRLNALLSRFAAKVIYCGDSIAEQHRKLGFSSQNMSTILNGFDTGRFSRSSECYRNIREQLGLSPEAKLVGMTARFHPHKDHSNFVRAAAIVKKNIPNVHFVLAGRGLDESNTDLKTLATELDVIDRLHLVGEYAKVERLIPSFDVYCLSSAAEGFPNSLGEAMACEVPCVTTNAGAALEVVGELGEIVPIKDSAKLAAALTRTLLLTPEQRLVVGQRCRRRVIENFSLQAIAAKYADVYRQTLKIPEPAVTFNSIVAQR